MKREEIGIKELSWEDEGKVMIGRSGKAQLKIDKIRIVKSIEEQTGWKRPHPQAICQDPQVLSSIEEYDFDLNDPEFIEYVIARTGQGFGREEKPEFAKWLLTSPDAEEFLRESEDFRYIDGRMVPFEDREFYLESIKISKGKLQDCWELYQSIFVI